MRLKSKEPRLRDWNNDTDQIVWIGYVAWNQKNLDYEIETGSVPAIEKSTPVALKSKEPRLRDWNLKRILNVVQRSLTTWNQKNLDYEIETISPNSTQHRT